MGFEGDCFPQSKPIELSLPQSRRTKPRPLLSWLLKSWRGEHTKASSTPLTSWPTLFFPLSCILIGSDQDG